MATRKVKRYADEGFVESGSGSDDALERANNSEESQAIANEARGEAILKNMRDADAAKAAKPTASALRNIPKPVADAAKEVKAEINTQAKADKKASSPAPTSSAKKDYYRDLSGKMREKTPDTSEADRVANRAKAWESIKGAASSVGD